MVVYARTWFLSNKRRDGFGNQFKVQEHRNNNGDTPWQLISHRYSKHVFVSAENTNSFAMARRRIYLRVSLFAVEEKATVQEDEAPKFHRVSSHGFGSPSVRNSIGGTGINSRAGSGGATIA